MARYCISGVSLPTYKQRSFTVGNTALCLDVLVNKTWCLVSGSYSVHKYLARLKGTGYFNGNVVTETKQSAVARPFCELMS